MKSLDLQNADFIRQQEFEKTASDAHTFAKQILNAIKTPFVKDLERCIDKAFEMMETLLKNEEILPLLTDIRILDDYTFKHSINVCTTSLISSIFMGYDGERLFELGAGALLHDVGKTKVPHAILKKPGRLSMQEFEEVKLHTRHGYEILSACSTLSPRAAYIAKAHHERMNGKGYPMGLVSYQIAEEAKIVAIADVYDALVSERIYRARMWPGEVLDYILAEESGYFDEEILRVFIKFLAVYPVGTPVVLSNNLRGIVVQDNVSIPYKPMIRINMEHQNLPMHQNASSLAWAEIESLGHLDLSIRKDLYIVKAEECL